jgi:hypothetical protein
MIEHLNITEGTLHLDIAAATGEPWTTMCSVDDAPFSDARLDSVTVRGSARRHGSKPRAESVDDDRHACFAVPLRDISVLCAEGAGLYDIAEFDVEAELVTQSSEQYWEMISEHVTLAVAALQRVEESTRKRIRARAIAEVTAFNKDGKIRVPGMARCIVGTKD